MVKLLNLLMLAQAAYVFGVTVIVMFHYWQTARHKAPRLFQHITAVAISYCILTARGVWAVFYGLVQTDDPWLYVLIVAFLLGDYALLKVVQRQYYPRLEQG